MDEVAKPETTKSEADPIPAAFKKISKALEGLNPIQQRRTIRAIAILLDVEISPS